MGLLLFAPTVSRTVQALEKHPSSAIECAEHVMGNALHSSKSGHAGSHYSLDACAYCSLLYDNPALPWAIEVLPALVPTAPIIAPCKTPTAPHLWPLNLCPRGPPEA